MADTQMTFKIGVDASSLSTMGNKLTKFFNDAAATLQKSNARMAASIGKNAQTLDVSLRKVAGTLSDIRVLALSFGAIQFGKRFTQDAIEFQRRLAEVNTQIVEGTLNINDYRKALMELGSRVPQSLSELTRGVYELLSSGIKNDRTSRGVLATMEAVSKAAVAGVSDTDHAAKAIIPVMNAYGKEMFDASKVSDQLFTLIRTGVVTMDKLATGMGRVSTISASFGVKIEEMNAALAQLTRVGLTFDQASTQLRALILGITDPAPKAAKVLDKLGISYGEAAFKTMGFAKILEQLNKAAGESPGDLAKVFPNIRALVGAVGLVSDSNIKGFKGLLAEFENATGAADQAYSKVAGESFNQIKIAFNAAQNALTGIALDSLPALESLAKAGSKAIISNIDDIKKVVAQLLEVIGDALRWTFYNLDLIMNLIDGFLSGKLISLLIQTFGTIKTGFENTRAAAGSFLNTFREITGAAEKARAAEAADFAARQAERSALRTAMQKQHAEQMAAYEAEKAQLLALAQAERARQTARAQTVLDRRSGLVDKASAAEYALLDKRNKLTEGALFAKEWRSIGGSEEDLSKYIRQQYGMSLSQFEKKVAMLDEKLALAQDKTRALAREADKAATALTNMQNAPITPKAGKLSAPGPLNLPPELVKEQAAKTATTWTQALSMGIKAGSSFIWAALKWVLNNPSLIGIFVAVGVMLANYISDAITESLSTVQEKAVSLYEMLTKDLMQQYRDFRARIRGFDNEEAAKENDRLQRLGILTAQGPKQVAVDGKYMTVGTGETQGLDPADVLRSLRPSEGQSFESWREQVNTTLETAVSPMSDKWQELADSHEKLADENAFIDDRIKQIKDQQASIPGTYAYGLERSRSGARGRREKTRARTADDSKLVKELAAEEQQLLALKEKNLATMNNTREDMDLIVAKEAELRQLADNIRIANFNNEKVLKQTTGTAKEYVDLWERLNKYMRETAALLLDIADIQGEITKQRLDVSLGRARLNIANDTSPYSNGSQQFDKVYDQEATQQAKLADIEYAQWETREKVAKEAHARALDRIDEEFRLRNEENNSWALKQAQDSRKMKKEERAEFLREMEIAKEQRLQALLDEQNARRSLEIANLSAFMLQADEAKAGLVKTWQEAIARITAVMNQAMTDMMNMLADTSVNIVSRMFEMSKNAIEGSLNEITRNIFSDVFQGFYRSLNGMKEDPNLGGLGKVGSFIGSAVGGPAGAVVGGVGMGLVALPELINSVKGIWASLKAGWAIIYKLPDQIWRAFEKNSLGKFINELTSEFIPNLVQFLIEKLVPALIALIPLLVVGILSGLGKTVDDALRTNPGTVAGAAIGAGLGAWAGSAVPVVGTWLGGAIGGVAGGYIGSLFHQGGTVRSGRNPMKAAAMAALGAPMFAEGGMVGRVPAALRSMMSFGDDTPIIAKYGEAVLNQQAVSRLGPGGVDALNRGMSVGQPPTSIVINARDDATAALAHMVIGTVSYDMSRVGGRTNRVVKGINRRYMPQPA